MYDFFAGFLPSFALIPFLFFVLSLAMLVKSADFFVDFAEQLGFKLGVPSFVVGVVVVGIGTSLPELATSIAAIVDSTPSSNLTEMISANIIGSNIANILLGIGIASFFRVIKINRNMQDNDLPFLFGSTAIAIFFLLDGILSFGEGFLLVVLFGIFLAFSLLSNKETIDSKIKKEAKHHSLSFLFFVLAASGTGIMISANLTIGSLIATAPILGIEKDVASMFLLAVGTSFPEIFVSVVAVRKGNSGLAIGNILGSNIGNTLGILGISALLMPIAVSEKSLAIGLPFLGIATFFFISSTLDNRVRVWEGAMAVMIFCAFLGKLFSVF